MLNFKKIIIASLFLGLFFLITSAFSFGKELELFEGQKDFNPAILNFDPTEMIVKFKGEKHFQVKKIKESFKLPEILKEFRNRADVEYAEPNFYAYAYFTPNDPYFRYQWHLQDQSKGGINTPLAWDLSQGAGVIVAVVDTGVAYENFGRYKKAPDLANTAFVAGYDFVQNDTHPNDDNGHGTHVAGTIAQSTNNNLGVAGGAFKAKIMPVKVLNKNGSGTYAQVASGIRFAADNGAKIINLSLGGPSPSQTLKDAVDYAKSKGALVIAAAGNDGKRGLGYPAAYTDSVMAVAATRIDKTKSYYSNYGPGLSISAPGGDLNVDQNNDGYGDGVLQQTIAGGNVGKFGYYFYQGTSMATPHVSAVAALVASQGISSPTDIRNILESTALDLGAPGWDENYGYGLVDAYKAVLEARTRTQTSGSVSSLVEGDTFSTSSNSLPKIKIRGLSVEDLTSIILNQGSRRLLIKIIIENQENENKIINLSLIFKDSQNKNLNWIIYGNNLNNITLEANNLRELIFFARTDQKAEQDNYLLEAQILDTNDTMIEKITYEFSLNSVKSRTMFKNNIFPVDFLDSVKPIENLIQKLNTVIDRRFF